MSSSEADADVTPQSAIQEAPESLWAALRQIGPGIILAGSIVGSGELIATTTLGADWGFTFLWLILLSCVIKVFVQVELGRYALSSGEPTLQFLNRLPGPRLGAHWTVWWWFLMLLGTVVQLGAMVGLVGQALDMAFPGVSPALASLLGTSTGLGAYIQNNPANPWGVLTAFAAVALLLSGGYLMLERFTTILVAGVTLVTVACVLALPWNNSPFEWDQILAGLKFRLPTDPQTGRLSAAGLAKAFAVFGITGVGAAELFAYPYWCLEKGYGRSVGPRSQDPAWARRANGWMRVMHLDAWVSCVVFTLATVSFYFLGARVLHALDLHPKGKDVIRTLAEMYEPAFGSWTKLVFLLGAWAVLFKTLYIASAGHARLTADFFQLNRLVEYPHDAARARVVRGLCVFYPMLALFFFLVLGEPVAMVTFGGFVQGVTLPVISLAAVYLRYRRLDRRIAPSPLTDGLFLFAAIAMSLFALYAAYDFLSKTFGAA